MAVSDEELLEYVERIARDYSGQGLPLIAGRVVGWLLVCDPPEQSASQLGETIGASKASVSTNLRLLLRMGLIAKVTKPGDRTAYYVIDVDLWYAAIRRSFGSLARVRDLFGDGVAILGADNLRARRLTELHEVYSQLEEDLREVWERWEKRLKDR